MCDNYIYNETMSGVVDGINTVFTTLEDIGKIEEVYLWGIAYRDVTFSGNEVTFVDAPPIGSAQPTIDYFTSSTPLSSTSSDVLFWDVINDTYEKIGSKKSSNVYLEDQIKKLINKWLQRIRNMKYYKDSVKQYTFNKAEDSYAVGYDATTVTITPANPDYIPVQWAILMWRSASFTRYENYLDGVLEASPGYIYDSWDRVSIGYKLPTGVKRPAEVIVDWVTLTYTDNREFVINPNNFCYTCITASCGNKYLFLPFSAQSVNVTVKYIPEYDIMTEDTDYVNIPYEYSEVLSYYASYNVLMVREDDRWQAVKAEYKEMLADMKAYLSRAVDWINNKFKSVPLVRGRQIFRRSTFK